MKEVRLDQGGVGGKYGQNTLYETLKELIEVFIFLKTFQNFNPKEVS